MGTVPKRSLDASRDKAVSKTTRLLPSSSKEDALLNHIRQAVSDVLLGRLQNQKRDDLLHFCAENSLFSTSIFSTEILEAIAGYIIEICGEWKWL